VVAKAALPFVMVTLVLVGLIYNQIRITRRSDVLKQMAQAILDASKRRDYSTPIESVNVPTLAFTETVIFRAKRSSNDQTEMFVANGANFIEHQVLQNSPSGIAQPKEKH
jgi:beta-mannanase